MLCVCNGTSGSSETAGETWACDVRGYTYRKVIVHKHSTDFRQATRIITTRLPTSLEPGQAVVRVMYTGINASDINYTAGFYTPGKSLPLDAGFEAVGEVVAINAPGSSVTIGSAVATTAYGAFGEFIVVDHRMLFPIPSAEPEMLPLLVSGLTASIALEQMGRIEAGETVLVTAAAGGTGQFAVQIAKAKGCKVIGTCSTRQKQEFLRSIGCDRAINYKTENLHKVLKSEFPNGIDVVYESVGGATFDTCVANLAVKGRLIVIGMVSGYVDGSAWKADEKQRGGPLSAKLLVKSASVCGFFLNHYTSIWKRHLAELAAMVQRGEIRSVVDDGDGMFVGLESIPHAIDHLYAGRNVGKIVVRVPRSVAQQRARL